ncbi:hypothetical protein FACS189475_05790 [Betaproteobacteria bacterium]|nr:hypothetical protein FACS189475_05790 [Betaproteobacteria bacterium]
MTAYVIPVEVGQDFQTFSRQHADYLAGRLDGQVFKTYRVPFGIYEQREAGTFMTRVKLAGGKITPTQLRTLADLAERYGNGKIHVTTRGGAQLHYVAIENVIAVIAELHRAGLTGRGGGGNTVRNITADPFAGVADDEVFDVTPHALALTSKMLAQKDSYALPRKYKIAFSGSDADRGGATYIDVGFIARIKDGRRGFRVYVAGGMGANFRLGDEFTDFLPEEEIFLLAQAIKEVFDAKGNRKNKHAARLRFLVAELGLEVFRELVRERIEVVKARGDWQIELPQAFAVEPLVGEHLPDFSPEEKLWFQRFARPQKQTGYYSVKLPLPLGDIAAADARALADALLAASPGAQGVETLRFSGDQNIYLRNLDAAALRALYPILKKISPLVAKPALLGDIVVCTGAATCQLGITVPRGAMGAIEKAVTKAGIDLDALQGFSIHLSGCPNSCGKHAVADLGFFGKALRNNGIPYPAYNVFAGAKIGACITRFARPVGEVAAFHLPAFIVEVLQAWLPQKATHTRFADWIDRSGEEIISGIAKKHVAVPDFDEDRNPYFDFSAKELFSLKGRGAGECSAGLYELIETDKKALTAALKEAPTPENLALIRLYSARMLLITRGEEARSKEEVLKAFKTLFIDAKLIDASFAPLLEGEVTPARLDELKRLAKAVIDLYGTMDYTLKFAVEREAAAATTPPQPGKSPAVPANAVGSAGEEAVHRFKDYRGVACPMNFVKTKMDLAQMKSGEILEILLDDGAPIDNVPASVKSEGHTVLSQTRQGDVWRVRIRKK